MSTLSHQSYEGSRDYYPEDRRLQGYIFSVWKAVAEGFGYEEYGVPLLEPVEIYAVRGGQELVGEQIYSFSDRGGRSVAIRPEMTPAVSRMIAAKRQEMAYPARLYSVANFMRYERLQNGGEHEFWQLNVDIFGVDGVLAEVEMITLASRTMAAFGATPNMYTIKVNSLKLISCMMSGYLGLDVVQSQLMIRLLERKSEISAEEFRGEAVQIFGEEASSVGLGKIATLLSATSVADLPDEIVDAEVAVPLRELFSKLKQRGVEAVEFDATLMRGHGYYTGIVFEVIDGATGNEHPLFGGGRYDGFVSLFGVESLPAAGMASELTAIEVFLRSHDLLPELVSTTEVYMVVVGDQAQQSAAMLADALRDEGVSVEVDITDRKIDRQIKTAIKKKVSFIIFVGDDEVRSGVYPCKDASTSEEQVLSFERIVSVVKDRRRRSTSSEDDLEL